ncbi:MAG: T9SS type A sorting domain-containing protein [Bacteroidetes bacterium]|nr:T9SS type A sorting domain-containing protein [Bacteroidota bacterium]
MKKICLLFALLITAFVVQAQNPFFEVVNYRGAFAPAPAAPWTDGWTNWDPQNTNYGTPNVTVNTEITTNTTWTSNNVYLIQGLIYVKNGATLTIQPGTKILGDANIANSSLVITKGSKINAVGTSTNPIVFSSSKPVGERSKGDWGGVIILGKGTLNRPGGVANIEGIAASADTEFGGGNAPDNEDNSGNFKYVRIEYGGYVFNTDQEINGLTLGAVGRNTIIDYVQCSFINDDAFEWFGGTVNAAHLVAYRSLDDDFDTDNGYSGSVQFALGVRDPLISDQSTGSTSEGFESDNDGQGSSNTPQTSCVFSNVTIIGPFRGETLSSWPTTFKFRRGARLRRNSGIKILNSVLMDYPYGVHIDGSAVRNNLRTGVTVFKDNIIAGTTRATEPGTASAVVDSLFNQSVFANDSLVSTTGILESPYDYLNPDYRPAIGSPALTGVNFTDAAFNNRKIVVSAVSSIRDVSYRGAFAPAPAAMWTEGWTNWDPINASYPAPTVTVTGTITSNTTWTSSNTYLISGLVYVASGVTLTIQPGTVIRGDATISNSSLIITKNAKLIAEGNISNPIVFTSSKAAGSRGVGDWGGLIILGRASLNRPGGVANIEGIAASTNTEYGGGAAPNDNDNSGVLKFVRVEFGGYVFNTDQEINGITFGAVGRGTVVDYVQVSYTNDDAFEWFGGTVNCAHLVAYRNLDDNWDTDFGYSGSVQFALGVRDPLISDQSTGSTSEGFESDNDGQGSSNSPQTRALFSNVTEIGPFRGTVLTSWPSTFKFRRAARIRRNSGLRLFNSILTDYPYGVFIDGSAVRANLQTGVTKFENNLIAGCFLALEPGTAPALRDSIFGTGAGLFKNDSLSTTANVFLNPYNYTEPDYRPGSQPLASTGAAFTDAAFNGLIAPCEEVSSPGVISGPTNIQGCDTSVTHTYSVVLKSDASSYIWTVPAGARIISGQGTRTIIVKFASIYVSGRAISVVASNVCGNSSPASSKIIYKNSTSTPGIITGLLDVCPAFSSPASELSTAVTYRISKVLNATSYEWTVPAGATLISGQGDSIITVQFARTFVSGSIAVRSINACNNSSFRTLTIFRRVANQPGAIQKSFVPNVLAQLAVCGKISETYTIRKVAFATSYVWSLKNGSNATIASVNGAGVNDTAVIVTFNSGFTTDSLMVTARTACSESINRRIFLSALSVTPAVTSLTSGTGNFAPCAGSTVTYTATASTPTNAQSAIATFRWTRPAGTEVVSANSDSSEITVNYLSVYKGGALSVRGVSACGILGSARSVTLQYLPPTPTSISGNATPCINSNVTYTVNISSPSISQAAVNGYSWTLPRNTSIVSGTPDSSSITIAITPLFTSGSISVKAKTACGVLGGARSFALTRCSVAPLPRAEENLISAAEVSNQLYPNPTKGKFTLTVNTGIAERVNVSVRLFDMTGKVVAQYNAINAGSVINSTYDASQLPNGVYNVQYTLGNRTKAIKMFIQK